MTEPMEHRDEDGGRLVLTPLDSGYFRLVASNGQAGELSLTEAELRWLVTTAGPAVLPRREPVR